MANKGSYDWWRANYETDTDYASVAKILSGWGHDCSSVEVDHFPPNKSYEGTLFAKSVSYGGRPAFPLPKYLHRFHRGDGGMGGHVSTTGSTFVAKGWTGDLSTSMQSGDFYGAMKQDIIDKQNVALMSAPGGSQSLRNLFNPLLAPGVALAHYLGLISDTQYYDLLVNFLN